MHCNVYNMNNSGTKTENYDQYGLCCSVVLVEICIQMDLSNMRRYLIPVEHLSLN